MKGPLELEPTIPGEELDLDSDWFTRDFVEFDDKLPIIAQEIISLEIPYKEIEGEDYDPDVADAIFGVMQKHLECFCDMTAEELEKSLVNVLIACNLVCLHSKGYVDMHENGGYSLTAKGQAYFNALWVNDDK